VYARVTRYEGGAADAIDEGVREARQNVLPKARELEGFRGVIGLADRETGEEITITLWESPTAMRESEEAGARLREQTLSEGERVASVGRYEVTLIELEEATMPEVMRG
jgi:heme-degrading monooxygenase HmoA